MTDYSVLDLVPVSEGGTVSDALTAATDLAVAAEQAGCIRSETLRATMAPGDMAVCRFTTISQPLSSFSPSENTPTSSSSSIACTGRPAPGETEWSLRESEGRRTAPTCRDESRLVPHLSRSRFVP